MTTRSHSALKRAGLIGCLTALLLAVTAWQAAAETLMMPNRDAAMGTSVVVWGVTTLPNGTSTYTIDFGDATLPATGTVGDGSYITATHTYATFGPMTAILTVINGATTEVATTLLHVFDTSTLTAVEVRGLGINMAIQDGLRYLWSTQSNRTNFSTTATTGWSNDSYTALVVLAFEDHGYSLPNDNSVPTGLYEKYLVQRGLNFLLDRMYTLNLTLQTAGDPCAGAGIGPAPCTGLTEPYPEGYQGSIVILPFAGSNALSRTVAGIAGTNNSGFVVGKTYGEILQRLVDSVAFGQNDVGTGQGGWYYSYNSSVSDGSTIGWNMIALLDAAAAGATMPAFVKTEFAAHAFPNALNTDGSFDYNADGNPASDYLPNMARGGTALQAMFYTGINGSAPASETFISDRWITSPFTDYLATCGNSALNNKGCAYAMFNVFKGLKLQGVTTLPGVGRAAGPGSIPANDWYADYQDWLVTNQTSPNTTGGGNWGTMGFSCCDNNAYANAAIAEIILSPVALVLPDPILFSTVGLSPATATNPVGTSHTVTATATSTGNTPVPGVAINFVVLTGPNAGQTGSATTDVNGQATFTYNDVGGAGTDTIQAYIVLTSGQLNSNIVSKTWTTLTAVSFMTGGGSVYTAQGKRVTHGGQLYCDTATLPNNLEINWGGNANFHLTALTSVTCSNDPAIAPNPPVASFDTMVGTGTGTYNKKPATISFIITDAGEPGVNDTFSFTITQGATTVLTVPAGTKVTNGNEQAHDQ